MKLIQAARGVLEEGFASFSLQNHPHLILLRPQFYKKRVAPLLIQWAVLWVKRQPSLRHEFAVAPTEVLEAYLSCNHTAPGSWSPNVRTAVECVRTSLPQHAIKLLNLAKGARCCVGADLAFIVCCLLCAGCRLGGRVHSPLPVQSEPRPLRARAAP